MHTSTFLFDFDGTIADTHHLIIEIVNQFSKEYDFNPIPEDEIDDYKDKNAREIIKALKVPILKIPMLIGKAKKIYNDEIERLKPFEGLKEALHQLKEQGIQLGIVSSNSLENINKFLSNHDINVFDYIHSTSRVMSKNTAIKKLLKQNNIALEKVIYVGDELRDIDAARKLNIPIVSVGWGYNSVKSLQAQNPNYLVNSPAELVEVCSSI